MPEFVHIEFPLEWGSVMWRYKLARTEYLHFASSVVASRHVRHVRHVKFEDRQSELPCYLRVADKRCQ